MLLQYWLPTWNFEPLKHPQTDPISMMLIVTAFGLFILYALIDMLQHDTFFGKCSFTTAQKDCQLRKADTYKSAWQYKIKMILLYGIIILLIFGKALLLINLRQIRGPASYTHDGGVIQTEVTITYFLQGLNPYSENYVETPMAEWGLNEYRTALYHYPYLPWTFVFSSPFYLLSQIILGWYDQRFVYLILFALTLILAQSMVKSLAGKLVTVALLGLNPILAEDVIFGQNDSFVLFWIVLGVWLISRNADSEAGLKPITTNMASIAIGLACASKPTAWFIVPFWLLYLLRDKLNMRNKLNLTGFENLSGLKWWLLLKPILKRAWTLPVIALLILLPWFLWDPTAMYDDVWRWSSGQGETGYQIWGWGASNYILAFNIIANRFEYWHFIIPQAIFGLPLLLFLLWRQIYDNTLGTVLYSYVIFLLVFFYLSRFMQPNYLGYLLACLTLAYFLPKPQPATTHLD
ncbi:MAG: hypothetical protein B6242_03510 [Anaerolineaceae bacterium 4572_78]|nr:MAG: hypothetical protein B6242_03510 [Anaerolineaceae bacterium 4572_78]